MWHDVIVIGKERDERQIYSDVVAIFDAQRELLGIVPLGNRKLNCLHRACTVESNHGGSVRLRGQLDARTRELIDDIFRRKHIRRKPHHFIERQIVRVRFDARATRQAHTGRHEPFRLCASAINRNLDAALVRYWDNVAECAELSVSPNKNFREVRRQVLRRAGKPIANRAIVNDAVVNLDSQIAQLVQIAPLDNVFESFRSQDFQMIENVTAKNNRLVREPKLVHHARTLTLHEHVYRHIASIEFARFLFEQTPFAVVVLPLMVCRLPGLCVAPEIPERRAAELILPLRDIERRNDPLFALADERIRAIRQIIGEEIERRINLNHLCRSRARRERWFDARRRRDDGVRAQGRRGNRHGGRW